MFGGYEMVWGLVRGWGGCIVYKSSQKYMYKDVFVWQGDNGD